MFRHSFAFNLALALTVMALAGCGLLPEDTVPPTSAPADTPPPASVTAAPRPAIISGRVWQDVCLSASSAPGLNCVPLDTSRYRADGLYQPGEPGLGGVTVNLGLSCPASADIAITTNPNGVFTFPGLPAGTYCLTVDPNLPANAGRLPGGWTAPFINDPNAPASLVVQVGEGEQKNGVDFGRDSRLGTVAPTATSTVVPTSVSATATPPVACTDRAAFVADVSIPDKTYLWPGTTFIKTWRLQNVGACAWNTNYALTFVSGDLLQGPAVIPLAGLVAPGGVVDLSVGLIAPTTAGVYRGEWKLRNASGVLFGVGAQADQTFWVQIVVGPTNAATLASTNTPTPTRQPTATSAPVIVNWRGEYFDNRNLAGNPVLVRDDAALDFDWGSGSPAARVPADHFAARWTRLLNFGAGTYRFHVLADDGVRLWVDEQIVVDDWRDGGAGEVTADVSLTQGAHSLRLEYYEAAGLAHLNLWWDAIGSPTFPDWKGEYWPNPSFTGAPALVRNDRTVNFDWGLNAPAVGLPANDFAARWSRWVTFEQGTYRFFANADDGLRLYLDGRPIIDEWHDSDGSRTYVVEQSLTGPHALLVEYFDRGGRAMVRVWWERLPATSTATPPPTSTPTATTPPTATSTATPTSTSTATPTSTSTSTPTNTPTATPTQSGLEASVSGRLWQDVCEATGQKGNPPGGPQRQGLTRPDDPPPGCIAYTDGLFRANGLMEPGEPAISDVVVILVEEPCGTLGVDLRTYEAVTNKVGTFHFAGLRAGAYCLMIPASTPANEPRLGQGVWTQPRLDYSAREAVITVQVGTGENKTDVNLGWDFLNAP